MSPSKSSERLGLLTSLGRSVGFMAPHRGRRATARRSASLCLSRGLPSATWWGACVNGTMWVHGACSGNFPIAPHPLVAPSCLAFVRHQGCHAIAAGRHLPTCPTVATHVGGKTILWMNGTRPKCASSATSAVIVLRMNC